MMHYGLLLAAADGWGCQESNIFNVKFTDRILSNKFSRWTVIVVICSSAEGSVCVDLELAY